MRISLVNQKGGVGKTTLAINLASYLVNKIDRKGVLLIDADPQASCIQWAKLAEAPGFEIVRHDRPDFHKTIDALTKGHRYALIDCPPGTSPITASALMVCDLALIPVTPSLLDLFSTKEMVEAVKAARSHNPRLRAALVITKAVTGTVPAKEAREGMEGFGLPILKAEIGHRIDFVRSMVEGKTIFRYAPGSQAAAELEALAREIF